MRHPLLNPRRRDASAAPQKVSSSGKPGAVTDFAGSADTASSAGSTPDGKGSGTLAIRAGNDCSREAAVSSQGEGCVKAAPAKLADARTGGFPESVCSPEEAVGCSCGLSHARDEASDAWGNEEGLFSEDDALGAGEDEGQIERLLSAAFPGPLPERVDRFLSRLPAARDVSRERIKQAVAAGQCLIDGGVCTDPAQKLRRGQIVVCRVSAGDSPLQPSAHPVDVLYEDDDIAVVNKPAGLTVHPCPSCAEETLVHRLLGRFPALQSFDGQRPGIVHRLDRDTSGLMVVALSEAARLRLVEMFSAREVHKTYLALVRGVPDEEGCCDQPVGRHPAQKIKMAVLPKNQGWGREALTEWQRMYADPSGVFSLLALRLHTGRTHQIRVHMQHCGHPLWGDRLYGHVLDSQSRTRPRERFDPAPRQMLHAWKLSFRHPLSGKELVFTCLPPPDFWRCAYALHRRMPRVVVTGCPASGKSVFCRAMAELKIPVWSADADVKRLYAAGGDIAEILAQRYGTRYVEKGGEVNKAALFASMQESESFRMELQGLVHPVVSVSMLAFFEQAEQAGEPLAVAEVPLWFESGYSRNLPVPPNVSLTVVGVSCPDAVRYSRLAEKRGWSMDTISVMDSWQWSNAKKMSACDMVIENSGTLDELASAAARVRDRVIREAEERDGDWLAKFKKLLEDTTE